MTTSRPLTAYEAHVWRSFAEVARAWRRDGQRQQAGQLRRWSRIAYTTQAPDAGDADWLRDLLRAIEAGRDLAGADFARRGRLWASIEPVLGRLDAAAGPHPGETEPPAPTAHPASPPYYLRD